ncbi:MAG TPA: radical SAM protein [Nitriliruptoraceae bacterium]|nr:radical SAM protein [Nitriliruptoraceae bacterium]
MTAAIREALATGELLDRLWFYSNYHCNLTCSYCFTESSPSTPPQALPPDQIIRLAHQAAELGYSQFGVTGGEPFILPYMVDVLKELAAIGSTVVISNGTLFNGQRLARAVELADHDVAVQISLDAPDPIVNDEFRGRANFDKVATAIPTLTAAGVHVRIATSIEPDRLDLEQHARLCAMHTEWGVDEADHIVRPLIARGRAADEGMGTTITFDEFPAELAVSVDGAYWGPFGPGVTNGVGDTDLLLTRTIEPLRVPAEAMLRVAGGRPAGSELAIVCA